VGYGEWNDGTNPPEHQPPLREIAVIFIRRKAVVGGQRRQDMSATETKGRALITGALLLSKPGFQRLSKAALSRSRFLRLAAAALLPFVGLRLSAAAATNPELAQSSGAPGA
jgi:hypothetical protein